MRRIDSTRFKGSGKLEIVTGLCDVVALRVEESIGSISRDIQDLQKDLYRGVSIGDAGDREYDVQSCRGGRPCGPRPDVSGLTRRNDVALALAWSELSGYRGGHPHNPRADVSRLIDRGDMATDIVLDPSWGIYGNEPSGNFSTPPTDSNRFHEDRRARGPTDPPSPLLPSLLTQEPEGLKYLGFVHVAALQAVVCLVGLYEFAKDNSGPLKPGVHSVECAVTAVIGPVYEKFRDVPYEILKFVDTKVLRSHLFSPLSCRTNP
ncbi:hypothetical protein B296_00041665 [Ensete ventricosum]|uniref:Uncharacterized protein n=1 Tax=Ensete ventricosum TaxID=4639 RepID=A0A426XL80_ENSVE|nr:hypothetical protein B296_00041665 [Ensete ventricosum]